MDNKDLLSERLQVERKVFFFDMKENARGRFLRITEDVSGRRDAIVIPASGLREFSEILHRIVADPAAAEESTSNED